MLFRSFFIAGWWANGANDNNQINDQAQFATTNPRYGVGGGPGSADVTPLPDDESTENVQMQTSETETEQTSTPSPTTTASPRSTSSPTMERTGDESSI